MNTPNLDPTESAAQSLANKLIEFDAGLSPSERAIFRARISASMESEEDVEGHRMEQRWEAAPDGLFLRWVHIDDSQESASSPSRIDPSRWNTLSASASPQPAAQLHENKLEGMA